MQAKVTSAVLFFSPEHITPVSESEANALDANEASTIAHDKVLKTLPHICSNLDTLSSSRTSTHIVLLRYSVMVRVMGVHTI